jgi:hypothetical protein
MTSTELNWISMQFDREISVAEDKTGQQLVPLFLDHILEDSCSQEVRDALEDAFYKFFLQKYKFMPKKEV